MKLLHILYKPYMWLVFMPFLLISTLIFGTIAATLSILINAKIGSLIGGVIWARLNGYITPMFVKVFGRENIDEKQSYVIVSNHQSNFDILALYGWLGVDFKWVMKHELRKIPGLGIGCEKIGHIFIDRSNSERAIASINSAKEKIINGTSVIFFPEGTRESTETTVGEFKKGAFKFAIDLGLPVLPVTLVNTCKILPPHSLDIFPGKVKLIIHEKIDIEGYNEGNIEKLMERAHSAIESGLKR